MDLEEVMEDQVEEVVHRILLHTLDQVDPEILLQFPHLKEIPADMAIEEHHHIRVAVVEAVLLVLEEIKHHHLHQLDPVVRDILHHLIIHPDQAKVGVEEVAAASTITQVNLI